MRQKPWESRSQPSSENCRNSKPLSIGHFDLVAQNDLLKTPLIQNLLSAIFSYLPALQSLAKIGTALVLNIMNHNP